MEARIVRAVLELFDYCGDVDNANIDNLLENEDEDLVEKLCSEWLVCNVDVLRGFQCIRKTIKHGTVTEKNIEIIKIARNLIELSTTMFEDDQYYCEDEMDIVKLNAVSSKLLKMFNQILQK